MCYLLLNCSYLWNIETVSAAQRDPKFAFVMEAILTNAAFTELHDLYSALEGRTAYREAADGKMKRRVVRVCKIDSDRKLAYAVRLLQPNGVDEFGWATKLASTYVLGSAVVYIEALQVKGRKLEFGEMRVGQLGDAMQSRLYPIHKLKNLPAVFS